MVHDAGILGVPRDTLAVRAGTRPSEVAAVLRSIADRTEELGPSIYDRAAIIELEQRVIALVSAHHERAPLDEGVSLQSVRAGLGAAPALAERVMSQLSASGVVTVGRGIVRRTGWVVRPSPAQQGALDTIARTVVAAGREPPSVTELAGAGLGQPQETVAALLRLLERNGVVRQVESDRYYGVETLKELTAALRGGMTRGREYGPAELREFLGVSRKYLIPLLEYFDRVGLTDRRAGGRVLADTPGADDAPESAGMSVG
jgi:selenocysteine-specific elongation factor